MIVVHRSIAWSLPSIKRTPSVLYRRGFSFFEEEKATHKASGRPSCVRHDIEVDLTGAEVEPLAGEGSVRQC